MSDKKLTILGIVACIMLILTIVQSYIVNRPPKPAVNAPLIQGLDTASIATIELGHGEKKVTLKKINGKFVVTNKDNYPARLEKINDLIYSILDITVKGEMTHNPDNFKDLEVTEDKAKNIVRFLDKKGKLITGIIVGKSDPQTGEVFVRRLSNDKDQTNIVYRADHTPWLQQNAMSYIGKDLFKVKKDDIYQVIVSGPEGQYTISANGAGKITLDNIPAGKKTKNTDYESVFTAAVNLSFDDVMKEGDKTADLKFDHHYVCKLKNSTIVTYDLAKKDDKTYAKCKAEYTAPLPKKANRVEKKEELKKKEDKLLAADTARKFTRNHQGWVYVIPSYKANDMVKKLDDLLEDIEKKPQAKTSKPATKTSKSNPDKPTTKNPAVKTTVKPAAKPAPKPTTTTKTSATKKPPTKSAKPSGNPKTNTNSNKKIPPKTTPKGK